MTAGRLAAALKRRVRLLFFRARFSRARFGSRCDVRRRFALSMGPSAVVEFGRCCVVDHDMTVECTGTLRVGEGTIFGHHCTMAARDSVTIGIDCLIAEMVSVRDHDHCFDRLDVATRDQGFSVAPVSIGKNVWLASKVSVLKGVTIGDNAIVGANAVVTRDIPANAIAVGIPARVIRIRGLLP